MVSTIAHTRFIGLCSNITTAAHQDSNTGLQQLDGNDGSMTVHFEATSTPFGPLKNKQIHKIQLKIDGQPYS